MCSMMNINLYFKYSVWRGASQNTSLLQNHFSLRLVYLPLCLIDIHVILLPSLLLQVMEEMERMNVGVGSQDSIESWGLGKSLLSLECCFGITLEARGQGYLFFIKWGHSPKSSFRSWSKINMRKENSFRSDLFFALVCNLHGVKKKVQ